jgi:hypothetical protein
MWACSIETVADRDALLYVNNLLPILNHFAVMTVEDVKGAPSPVTATNSMPQPKCEHMSWLEI